MGCGCGGGRRGGGGVRIRNAAINTNSRKQCPKCGGAMILKQQYSPRQRKYVKIWECTKCKKKLPGNK